ncbi:MAG: glutamine-hydrolyzing carbamoyl-phosphate synthase small subunit [Proteobacteria bacterium]|nr:glutamine-hydrolyzing carbamoyl-phosphate synthase small subunit [Pseudomonadota bacterium]NIS70856.1 glutamine-hydrolyzing carbamoyl-phosphate synthase small subunit [Pseudomonadota bacterium]
MVVLEDGTSFEGTSFGGFGERTGEIVFNTSMTGYQEILTDPSYRGQIVTMTYPLIGNYGVNVVDMESSAPQVEGFIVKEYSESFSNWRGQISLGDFLKEHHVVGVEGIDTRALTKRIRTVGAMKAIISTEVLNTKNLLEKARASPSLIGRDLVREVTCQKPYRWHLDPERDGWSTVSPEVGSPLGDGEALFSVVAMDFGVKRNILRMLQAQGCAITVVPADTSAEKILSYNPDGIFLSNGPGDPKGVPYVVDTVKDLLGQKPIYGICLGHQILGLVLGGKTYKLKFGHRGANQPVKNLKTGRVSITTQNHGFCVEIDSLDQRVTEVTSINLNDGTLEGMRHRWFPAHSVQFHPEASPGPHDANHLFSEFVQDMAKGKNA